MSELKTEMEFARMLTMAQSLSEADRLAIMDMGFYNDAMRGYLIAAMRAAALDEPQIYAALHALHDVLNDTSAAQATQIWHRY